MYSIPTVTVQNSKGETAVVDKYQYNLGISPFKPPALGGDWRVISENHKEDAEGHEKNKKLNDLIQGLKEKREEEPLKKRIEMDQ